MKETSMRGSTEPALSGAPVRLEIDELENADRVAEVIDLSEPRGGPIMEVEISGRLA
jgi:hypothetical protein